MATNNQPNFVRNLYLFWGGAYESDAFAAYLAVAANIFIGTNPPYGIGDFFAIYSKFFGCATSYQLTTTVNMNTVTISQNTTGIAPTVGSMIVANGFAPGTIIMAVSGTSLTLSNSASATATGVVADAYLKPWVPLVVMQIFINLASASIMQARWKTTWTFGMALFIAHYVTLWMQTETQPQGTAAQVANSGLQQGMLVSEAAGDVSAGLKPIEIAEAGAYNLTDYGVQFATYAYGGIGAGIMYVP